MAERMDERTTGFTLQEEMGSQWGKKVPEGANILAGHIRTMPEFVRSDLQFGVEGRQLPASAIANNLEIFAEDFLANQRSRKPGKPIIALDPILEAQVIDLLLHNGVDTRKESDVLRKRLDVLASEITANDSPTAMENMKGKALGLAGSVRSGIVRGVTGVREMGVQFSYDLQDAAEARKIGRLARKQAKENKKQGLESLEGFVAALSEAMPVFDSVYVDGGFDHPRTKFHASITNLIQKGWFKEIKFSDWKAAVLAKPVEPVVADIKLKTGEYVHIDSAEQEQSPVRSKDQMISFETALYSVAKSEALVRAALEKADVAYRVSYETEAKKGVSASKSVEKADGSSKIDFETLKLDALRDIQKSMINGEISKARPGQNMTLRDLEKHTESYLTARGVAEGTVAAFAIVTFILSACSPAVATEAPSSIDLKAQAPFSTSYGGSPIDADDVVVDFNDHLPNVDVKVQAAMEASGYFKSGDGFVIIGRNFVDQEGESEPMVLVLKTDQDNEESDLYLYSDSQNLPPFFVPAGQGDGGFLTPLYAGVKENGDEFWGFVDAENQFTGAEIFTFEYDADRNIVRTIYHSPYSGGRDIPFGGRPEWLPKVDFSFTSYNPDQAPVAIQTSTPGSEVVTDPANPPAGGTGEPPETATEAAPVGFGQEQMQAIFQEEGIAFTPETTNTYSDQNGVKRCVFNFSNGLRKASQVEYIQLPPEIVKFVCLRNFQEYMLIQRNNSGYLLGEFGKYPLDSTTFDLDTQNEILESVNKILNEQGNLPMKIWDRNGNIHTSNIQSIEFNFLNKGEFEKVRSRFDDKNIDYGITPDTMYHPGGDVTMPATQDSKTMATFVGNKLVVIMYNRGDPNNVTPSNQNYINTAFELLTPESINAYYSYVTDPKKLEIWRYRYMYASIVQSLLGRTNGELDLFIIPPDKLFDGQPEGGDAWPNISQAEYFGDGYSKEEEYSKETFVP